MTVVVSHEPGSFCWIELAAADAAAGLQFYPAVFGWSVLERPLGDLGTYYLFQKDGRTAAAMYQMAPATPAVPPHWMSYVAVTSADEVAEKAKALGASIIDEPFDVGERGRMAVVADPQGAVFAIWQAREHPGLAVRDEVNTLCWNELHARDLAAAREFYPALFGWRLKKSADYTEFHLGAHAVGGMLRAQATAHQPTHWLPYFAVEDCDAALGRALSRGAATHLGPCEIPHVGRFAIASDPQGAPFAIIRLQM